jgi:hypothetical protein
MPEDFTNSKSVGAARVGTPDFTSEAKQSSAEAAAPS